MKLEETELVFSPGYWTSNRRDTFGKNFYYYGRLLFRDIPVPHQYTSYINGTTFNFEFSVPDFIRNRSSNSHETV